MIVNGKTRDASSALRVADDPDWFRTTGRSHDTPQGESNVAHVRLGNREESAVPVDRRFAKRAAPSVGPSHVNSSSNAISETGMLPQTIQQSSGSRAERKSILDSTATLISKSAHIQQIIAGLERHTRWLRGSNHFETAIEGFAIVCSEHSVQAVRRASKSALCVTLQGVERTMVGEKHCEFRAGQAFILSVEEPCRCTVPDAGTMGPYLGLVIELDLASMQQVVVELGLRLKPTRDHRASNDRVLDLSPQLLNCALNIVRLLDTPEAIPMLYPGIMREMCYWLLNSPAGDQIIDLTMAHGHDARVLKAVQNLRSKFSHPIKVEQLASDAGMSPATFHRQFKSVTSMSPMQYQKQLRLVEARRLMITSDFNVESVAYEVGYVSASQFSREYTRMFGKPPRRDMSACRSSQSAALHVA